MYMRDFKCEKCGACCYVPLGMLAFLDASIIDFHRFDSQGKCQFLTENNECEIYADRPDYCKVAYNAKNVAPFIGISESEYWRVRPKLCSIARLVREVQVKWQ